MNHPFTAPREEDLHLLESDPGAVLAKAYDVILNGGSWAAAASVSTIARRRPRCSACSA